MKNAILVINLQFVIKGTLNIKYWRGNNLEPKGNCTLLLIQIKPSDTFFSITENLRFRGPKLEFCISTVTLQMWTNLLNFSVSLTVSEKTVHLHVQDHVTFRVHWHQNQRKIKEVLRFYGHLTLRVKMINLLYIYTDFTV